MRSPDARIARIAERQHGVFACAQALACGFTPSAIEYRLKAGRWRRVHRGVYQLVGSRGVFEQDAMAGVLVGGAGAVASHTTAGALFQLEGIDRGKIEIIVPRDRRVRVSGLNAHHIDLRRGDRTTILGIPVTAPNRTFIDLARVVVIESLEDALDDAIRRRLVRPASLQARLEEMDRRGCAGIGVLLELVRKRTPKNVPGSRRESRVRRELVKAGLPEPVRQYEIRDQAGGFVARVDLAYPQERLYIEYDGAIHLDPRQRAADLERQNRLSELGWRPLRFIDADMGKPASVLATTVRNARAASRDARPG